MVRVTFRALLFVLGFYHISVDDRRSRSLSSSSPPAPVVVSNHVGYFDVWSLVSTFGCGVVVSGGVLNSPFLGTLFQVLNSISVDRGSQSGRDHARTALLRRVAASSVDHHSHPIPAHASLPVPLLVFAEGCTSADDTLCGFRPGAFLPMLPVQPVCVTYPDCSVDFYHGRGGGCTLETLLYQLSQLWCSQKLLILDAMPPNKGEEPIQFAARVRQVMADVMQLPPTHLSDHSFADVRLHVAARASGLPPPLFTARECKQLLRLDVADVEAAMAQFAAADSQPSRKLGDSEELVLYLEGLAARRMTRAGKEEGCCRSKKHD